MKQQWPAPERNKEPILAVLRRVLAPGGTLLELSSGSGQHAAYFAAALPGWTWLPSDIDPQNLASIAAHRAEGALANLAEPRALDVCDEVWDVPRLDAAFNANMIHIAPLPCCVGLLRGVGRQLRVGGVFVLYGPMKIAGEHTAASNAEFDRGLQARDPRWGVRDLETVVQLAEAERLSFRERVAMPANNQCVVFERID
jgi:SAM-dependent methyltransferase